MSSESNYGKSLCEYKTLDTYNQSTTNSPPVPATTVSGKYLVPANYVNVSNQTLHVGCSRYGNIINAYGKNADKCDPKYKIVSCMPKHHPHPSPTGHPGGHHPSSTGHPGHHPAGPHGPHVTPIPHPHSNGAHNAHNMNW